MKLLTKEITDKLPPLYTQDGKGDAALVVVKFFTPWSSWTWYATEASARMADGSFRPLNDPADRIDFADESRKVDDVIFFGLVVGLETELGYFSLAELAKLRGPGGLKIERDLYWSPKSLGEVRANP